MTVKIAYGGFWGGFDPNKNWLSQMFKGYFNEDIEFSADVKNSDIAVCSVFSNVETNARRIFYTGESRKTFIKDGDILLGFDPTDKIKNSYRLPLWMLYINWWEEDYKTEDCCYTVDLDYLTSKISFNEVEKILSRKYPCAMVASNLTHNRLAAFTCINDNLFSVHGYGKVFNNIYYSGSKIELLKDYLFNISFENTIAEGYVTEKLFEAKLSGCIPIYWGDEWCKKDFNEKSFIYCNDMTYSDLIEKIKILLSSKDATFDMVSEPLFKEKPSLDGLYTFFDDIKLKG